MTDENQDKYIRTIKSFVIRAGRMTDGQKTAFEQHWKEQGLELDAGLLNFSEVFGNDNPVVLEIGFGMGKSLIEMAVARPDINYIGVEVHMPGVGRILRDAQEQNVKNLRVFRDDAIEVLDKCIADGSLQGVQLFFPDPWHKKKHNKRRIVQPHFAQQIRRKLKQGGLFHMATDWQPYAEHMLEVMAVAEGYENTAPDNAYCPRPDFRPLTKFENRGEKLGHGVWDLIFKKIG